MWLVTSWLISPDEMRRPAGCPVRDQGTGERNSGNARRFLTAWVGVIRLSSPSNGMPASSSAGLCQISVRPGASNFQTANRFLCRAGDCSDDTGPAPRAIGPVSNTAPKLLLCGAEPEVRIHLPPADSPSLTGSNAPRSRSPAFRAGVRDLGDGAVGRDEDRAAIWRLPAPVSLLGQIPVPQCQGCGPRWLQLLPSAAGGGSAGQTEAEHPPLLIPGERQPRVRQQLVRSQIARLAPVEDG